MYYVTKHAAERLRERLKLGINQFDATDIIQKHMPNSVLIRRHCSNPKISYYLSVDLKAIFVVNKEKRIVITVYNVRSQ